MAKRRQVARRNQSGPRHWFWLLGAVVGAAAVYLLWHRPSGSIPIPGEATEPTAKARAPKEEITNSDRDALERMLRERPKPR